MRLAEGRATVGDVDAFLADLDAIATETGCTIQAFDARCVVDATHLRRAVELADRAVDRGENVARDRGVEILLYAAGRRQIDRALGMGVAEGDCPLVVVCDAGGGREEADDDAERRAAGRVRDLLDPADTLGDYEPERVRDFFDVTRTELDATAGTLPDVVHERVALLDVRK
ncbi:KEOPS complex subunit Cgi121 [Candidatus Halobonum tyrrellensis]|uniref:KEOPS complex Cgi121-like subunit n=1 Tax=Candidatus Halobonum tyrrellensis G22 TaxID=1324957 RepID=V4HJ55_9EURY|nr:KEOPS complex subunit Cgi121 [Candidatus Halobonum tyrrellensis]ESP87954.1 KEOPS complex Cgi121-like subunit [Candidatus Halobonum tyrrellensis G22]